MIMARLIQHVPQLRLIAEAATTACGTTNRQSEGASLRELSALDFGMILEPGG